MALFGLASITHGEHQAVRFQEQTGYRDGGIHHAAVIVAQIHQQALQRFASQFVDGIRNFLGRLLLEPRQVYVAETGGKR